MSQILWGVRAGLSFLGMGTWSVETTIDLACVGQTKFTSLWYSAPQRRTYWEQALKKVTQRKWYLLSAQFLGHKVPYTRPHLPQIIEDIFFS